MASASLQERLDKDIGVVNSWYQRVSVDAKRNQDTRCWEVVATCEVCKRREVTDYAIGDADIEHEISMGRTLVTRIDMSLCVVMRDCVFCECVPAQTAAEAIGEAVDESPDTFDGLTAAECLAQYERLQRVDVAHAGVQGPLRTLNALTPLQLEVARREWSAALRSRVEEQKAKERVQVMVDVQEVE